MSDDASPESDPQVPTQEEGFFDTANAEEEAFGHQPTARKVATMALMLALMLGGGVCVAWAIIAASK